MLGVALAKLVFDSTEKSMGDSPSNLEKPTPAPGSIANFGDLANRILESQIAARQPQPKPLSNLNPPPQSDLPQSEPPRPEPWRPLEITPPAWSPVQGPTLPTDVQKPAFTLERIPTLQLGRPPSEDASTIYHSNSKEAEIYDANRQSIVRIFGPAKDSQSNKEYTGTGFVISNHGDIATAYHVIGDLSSINVTTSDGVVHPGKVVAVRPSSDIAIISIGADQATKPVSLADNSNSLHTGDSIYSIGHPAGWRKEYLSPGTFNSTDTARDLGFTDIDGQNPNHILLDVKQNIQGGDSGGPVFDANGKVVGIVSRSDSRSSAYMVSVNDLWPIMDKVSTPVQTTSYRPTDVPFAPHIGYDEMTYSATSAMLAGQMLTKSRLFMGLGSAGIGANAALGAAELVRQDLPFLHTAMQNGTTREKVSAWADVSADAMMIGGFAMTVVPKLRAIAPAVSLAGSLVRLGNGVAAFRSYS
jgi:S1-C subfamily serine protease